MPQRLKLIFFFELLIIVHAQLFERLKYGYWDVHLNETNIHFIIFIIDQLYFFKKVTWSDDSLGHHSERASSWGKSTKSVLNISSTIKEDHSSSSSSTSIETTSAFARRTQKAKSASTAKIQTNPVVTRKKTWWRQLWHQFFFFFFLKL